MKHASKELTKNFKMQKVKGMDEPVPEDILREINRGVWTIGYTGQSPERLQAHMRNMHVFDIKTLRARGGKDAKTGYVLDGDYFGLPWPCWGTPALKHPGSPNLYDTSKHVMDGGGNFRANFGVEREGQSLLAADGSASKGADLQFGYPEFDANFLKKLGWWDELTDDEKKPAERKNWKTDTSGGIIRVVMKNHGCHPFGNAKARAVVWNFPDPIPIHGEPLYGTRPDLMEKYPAQADKRAFWRLPTLFISVQEEPHYGSRCARGAVRGCVLPLAAALLLAIAPSPSAAKFDPSRRWLVAETPHFVVLYPEECGRLAARAAALAEEVHERLAPRIGWEPRSRTRLILSDDGDAAGGWATPYPYNQMLVTVAPPLGEPGFGTTVHDDWLRLVIAHEVRPRPAARHGLPPPARPALGLRPALLPERAAAGVAGRGGGHVRGDRADRGGARALPRRGDGAAHGLPRRARLLTVSQLHSALVLVPFADIQRRVVVDVPPELLVVIYRRFMLRIADRLARRAGARALVTGEVVGQVASQPLDNLASIDNASTLPVLRPLVGMDKEEITAEARRIGTYEITILPEEDCCQVFAPRHPATRSHHEPLAQIEGAPDTEALVEAAVMAAEREEYRGV